MKLILTKGGDPVKTEVGKHGRKEGQSEDSREQIGNKSNQCRLSASFAERGDPVETELSKEGTQAAGASGSNVAQPAKVFTCVGAMLTNNFGRSSGFEIIK